jgi:kinesin family protein 3/17
LIEELQLSADPAQFLEYTFQVKCSVDNIIEALSQPNDGMKLQSVAKDLINLQKLVGVQTGQLEQIMGNQQHHKQFGQNIQNTYQSKPIR